MITSCSQYFTIFLVSVILFTKCSECDDDQISYAIPQPKIEAFSRGFRVSIPDQEGVNLFAFHGNINIPMEDLEAGQYSKDILKPENGHWVFENAMAKLHVGDRINYWLFVIRFNLGYRLDKGEFVVTEITPYKPLRSDPEPPAHEQKNETSGWFFEPLDNTRPINFSPNRQVTLTTERQPSKGMQTSKVMQTILTQQKPISTCCQLFLNLTNNISILSEEIDQLREENKILMKIAEKNDYYATSLQIFGKYPNEYYPTPKDFVQTLIIETLKLKDVKVVEAKKVPDNGVGFKVETLSDKVRIILASQERLQGTNYELSW